MAFQCVPEYRYQQWCEGITSGFHTLYRRCKDDDELNRSIAEFGKIVFDQVWDKEVFTAPVLEYVQALFDSREVWEESKHKESFYVSPTILLGWKPDERDAWFYKDHLQWEEKEKKRQQIQKNRARKAGTQAKTAQAHIEKNYKGCEMVRCPYCGAGQKSRCAVTTRKRGGRSHPHKERVKAWEEKLAGIERQKKLDEKLRQPYVCTCSKCLEEGLSDQAGILPCPPNDDGTFGDSRIDDVFCHRVNPPGYLHTKEYWDDPHERARRARAKWVMQYDAGIRKSLPPQREGSGPWEFPKEKVTRRFVRSFSYGSEPNVHMMTADHWWPANARAGKCPSLDYYDKVRLD